jgi:hypothetical protein
LEYLLDKANLKTTCQDTLEAILALLIYGLILFPNLDDFVDMNVIMIFPPRIRFLLCWLTHTMLFTIDLARVVDTFFAVYLSSIGGLFRTFRSLSMII